MSLTEEPARPRAPLWMKLLLVLSLAANLLVAGLVIGHWLADSEPQSGMDRRVGWMLRVVPEERRELAAAHFEAGRPQFEAAEAAQHDRVGAVLAAIRSEPFEPAALSAAMAASLEARTAPRVVVYDRFATLLEQFTPAERAVIAERMEAWVGRRAAEQRD